MKNQSLELEEKEILISLIKKLISSVLFLILFLFNFMAGGLFLIISLYVYDSRGKEELDDYIKMLLGVISIPLGILFLGIIFSIG